MTAVSRLSPDPPTEMRLRVAGEWLVARPEGALWWEAGRLLVVSDLHFEKGSSFARSGQLLPPLDTAATLDRLETLIAQLAPQSVISLGDSFHDRQAEARLDPALRARIRALTERCDWVWVEGNHDPDPPQHLGGRAAREVRLSGLVLRHEPTGEAGEIAGHLHPCARIAGRAGSLRTRCFAADGQRVVLPAFGAFTGGLNVLDPAFAAVFPAGLTVFATGGARVYAVAPGRLRPDRAKGAKWKL